MLYIQHYIKMVHVWLKYNGLAILRKTTKLIDALHICHYFYVFYVFQIYVFCRISYVFSNYVLEQKLAYYWQPIVSCIWRIDWYQYEWPWPLFGERSFQPLCYIRHWISRKPLEIEAWFQRTTNRKWPMANRLVTWLMTSLNPKNRTRGPSTQSPISRKQLEMLFSNNR